MVAEFYESVLLPVLELNRAAPSRTYAQGAGRRRAARALAGQIAAPADSDQALWARVDHDGKRSSTFGASRSTDRILALVGLDLMTTNSNLLAELAASGAPVQRLDAGKAA